MIFENYYLSVSLFLILYAVIHETAHILALLYEDNFKTIKIRWDMGAIAVEQKRKIKNKFLVYMSGLMANMLTYDVLLSLIDYQIGIGGYMLISLFGASYDVGSYMMEINNIEKLNITISHIDFNYPFIHLNKVITYGKAT